MGGFNPLGISDEARQGLVSMGLGMMGRMVLVGVGLVITLKVQQAEPFGFVLAFFPLFFVFLILELLVAARHVPAPATPAAKES
jgi:hypothetical protein